MEKIEKTLSPPNILYMFLELCKAEDYSVMLEYDTGRFVSGVHLMDADGNHTSEEYRKQHIEQGAQGWRIEVGGYTSNELFPTLDGAVTAGIAILRSLLQERRA